MSVVPALSDVSQVNDVRSIIIEALYRGILRRSADEFGLNSKIDQIAWRDPVLEISNIINDMMSSDEYRILRRGTAITTTESLFPSRLQVTPTPHSRALPGSKFLTLRDISTALASHCINCGIDTGVIREKLAEEIDLGQQLVRDTYQACLGRLPEDEILDKQYTSSKEAADHILEALWSDEFIAKFPEMIGASFPEARRVFFIHIPKTAGSELIRRFKMHDFCFWHSSYTRADVSQQEILTILATQAKTPSRPIFIAGHQPIGSILGRSLLRSYDITFSVIRNPKDVVVSFLNYILTLSISCENRGDSVRFRDLIRSTGCAAPNNEGDVNPELIEKIVMSKFFREECRGLLARYLSENERATSVMATIKRCAIDIVDVTKIDQYAKAQFGIHETEKTNVSTKFIKNFSELPYKVREYISSELIWDDERLYLELISQMNSDGFVRMCRN